MYKHYSSPDFEKQYTYHGSDLGAVWTPEKTVFRLWAPTASAVWVNLYADGLAGQSDRIGQLSMQPDVCGTWIAEKTGNLHGVYYTYQAELDGKTVEACDPYARTTGPNGQRAMVLNPNATEPEGWDGDCNPHAAQKMTDAVIYELHVRDLSMDKNSGIRNRGKFLGLAETGTTTPTGHPTGLDHIRNLGVTHVHLLPVYDFGFTDERLAEPQYNWGYDPVNYNVPEGSYATDPGNGAVRVAELKQAVRAMHKNGISVVMDVVYNHVYEGEDFCFNRLVPGYFSRIDGEGRWSNGSYCGNDTASERSMVRKYIVDSVNYWADEYHIDGFRFDLVGLIDVETICEIVETVTKKHPGTIFYGEGWNMPTALTKPAMAMAIQSNSGLTPGFAYFSDTIRDLLRGSMQNHRAPGFAAGGAVSKEALEACFLGMPAWAAQPCQCVNYASCHDNHTLFDRISLSVPEASEADRARMCRLAAAFAMLSQGIPFLQAGEELLRTKPGKDGGFDENSYRSPDSVNAIRWQDLGKEHHRKTAEYYRGLIAFRKAHPGLRLATREAVLAQVHPVAVDGDHTLAFRIQEADGEIFLVFHAGTKPAEIPLPEGRWNVCIREDWAGTETLGHAEGTVTAAPVSATVLTKFNGQI